MKARHGVLFTKTKFDKTKGTTSMVKTEKCCYGSKNMWTAN